MATKKATVTEAVSESGPGLGVAAIVKAAIEAAGANNTGIAEAITAALDAREGKKRAKVGDRITKTPFNPTGKKRTLKHEFFQNGFPIKEKFVSDNEIDLLHKLVPGKFGPSDWPIVVEEKKHSDGRKQVRILYNETRDDRNRFKNYAAKYGSADFYGFLNGLVQEAKDQKARKKAEARALLNDDDSAEA